MITDALLAFLHTLAQALATFLLTSIPVLPGFLSDLTDAFTTVYNTVPGPVKYFLPMSAMVIAGTTLVGLYIVLGFIRFSRRVLSLFTGGGGNA